MMTAGHPRRAVVVVIAILPSPPWRTGWRILSFRRMYRAGTALDEKMLAVMAGSVSLSWVLLRRD